MPDFSKAKIYKLVSNKSSDIYIGSCLVELSKRFSVHKTPSNKCVSKSMFVDDAIITIVLIENYQCENKNQMKARELHYITTLQCINKNKPFVCDINYSDYKEWQKQYQLEHGEQIKQQKQQYNINNAEQIKQHKNQYHLEHKEQIKQYLLENIEHIKQQKKQYNIVHAEEIKQQHKQYRLTHAEEYKQYDKQYNLTHAEEKKQYNKQYYLNKKLIAQTINTTVNNINNIINS